MEITISQYLDYINSLINCNYNFSEKEKQSYKNSLSIIQQKAQSNKLLLAVVGEFSSGKSTFINAFLRKPLLKAACKATTASSTYIEKGGALFNLAVNIENNKLTADETNFSALQAEVRKYHEADTPLNNIYEILNCLTSEQSVANHVKEIQIQIPDDNLPDNVIIIDTPGINPGDELAINHHAITKNVVENIADMAIVLIPAHAAMSSTLEDFLTDSLSRFLHRCIFVITAMDNENPEDRDDIVQFVKKRLTQNLKVQDPPIFDESVITVLPVQKIPENKKHEWQYWQNRFFDFEKFVWERLARQKDVVITEHLYFLLQNILSDLKKDLEENGRELQKAKNILSSSKLSKIEQLTENLLNSAKTQVQTKFNTLDFSVYSYETESIYKSNAVIEKGGDLKNFSKDQAPEIEIILKAQAQSYIQKVNKQIDKFTVLCDNITENFKAEFKKHYSNFPVLSSNIQMINTLNKVTIPHIDFNKTISYITEAEKKSEKGANYGAAGGAIAGTFILPGVGTVIGLFIGIIISAFITEDTEKRQRDVKEKTKEGITKFFMNLRDQITKNVKNAQKSINSQFQTICGNHIREYSEKVDSLIKEQEEKEKRLEEQTGAIKKEIDILEIIEDEVKNKRSELKFI